MGIDRQTTITKNPHDDDDIHDGHDDDVNTNYTGRRRMSNTHIDPNSYQSHVNNPISSTRLEMLDDPLDEWYLDRKPSSSSTSSSIYRSTTMSSTMTTSTDPFELSKTDLDNLSQNIKLDLIGNNHPLLCEVASYFFEEGQDKGKKIRPMMVILLSRAMQIHTTTTTTKQQQSNTNVNDSNSNDGNFNGYGSDNDNDNDTDTSGTHNLNYYKAFRPDLFQAQQRLAEITEMLHTASLFHDDVIDNADTRRGVPTVQKVFGNKMAILAGDYLLARASLYLSRLRDVEVVETMSTIIEHLVRGEVMQLKGADMNNSNNERMIQYLRKNFYKTASLMANSCKSAAILGDFNDEIVTAAYNYGKHLGVAFQLVDDVLDYDGSETFMGKPSLSDINAGLATAPVLFAADMYPDELRPLIERKFSVEGDVESAVTFVRNSDGIQRTKDLAQVHIELAIDSISRLGPSAYRDSLIHLAHKVVDRSR